MTQTIQIKRSTSTAAPTSLANGELAYSANSSKLYIGRPGGTTGDIDAIGGAFYTNWIDTFAETNDLTAAVTWANVPDANITESSVTQHQAALSITESQISDLQAYLTAETDTLDSVTGRGATTTNALTVGGLTINGNLTVSGTTTTVNTEEVNIADNFVLLNSNFTGTASENAGIEVERGDDPNVQIRFNETADAWELTNDGSTFNAIATGASVRTDEEIEDLAGGLTTAGTQTNITVTYDDANSALNYSVAPATSAELGVASFNSTEFSVTSGAVAIIALDGGSF